ncbi:MAG: hypothetical protein C6W55_04390 [Thermobacillus sp.]|uniref:Putative periplasmic solute-binding protein n=1 Tax=Thermobacillus composti (strain DSM 18247 / JCM 13945 / KWC4) TaxID=717605 RepID=L0EEY1_THECK|nr:MULTISPECIES: periplasmic solute-binding protein [Thermobacillus]AGA58194.1 putative periplasmic solute-binding protein [Thermobacillus composti KWC4]REK57929.1 MAG: hypothetical protein C6W55_04390 [Thermobacillus sp.]
MVDKRSLLLGLGIGLIAGAVLLQLMLAGREQSERLADIGRLTGEDALYTQSELDARIAEAEARVRREYEQAAVVAGEADAGITDDTPAADGTNDSGASSAGESGESPSAESGEPSANVGEQTGEAEAGNTDEGVNANIKIRIKPGMTLTETAGLLESKGVIDDADALMELMARMSTRIRAGYYTFTGNETLEEVRTIITSRPSD